MNVVYFLFTPDQYGPFHISEDAPLGTTVTAVLAGDADVRGGDSWQVNYRLESGNEEEVFTLVTDKQTNEVSLVLSKVNSVLWSMSAQMHFTTLLNVHFTNIHNQPKTTDRNCSDFVFFNFFRVRENTNLPSGIWNYI